MPARTLGDWLDWQSVRDRVDSVGVAGALLGPAPGRRGARDRRAWWHCPFHEDRNPSFAIEPGRPRWRCYGCGEHGDIANLVMRLKGLSFQKAVHWLVEQAGIIVPWRGTARQPSTAMAPNLEFSRKATEVRKKPPDRPSGLPIQEAIRLVEAAQTSLWTPEGSEALAHLRSRGLTDGTIGQARLGWTPGVMVPTRDGDRYWRVSGIVIPWNHDDRLALIKIRQPEGRIPKYVEAFRDRPMLFPDQGVIRPGAPLIVVEGELDCLLMGQELDGLAAVMTLGSASNGSSADVMSIMLSAPTWYLASDADPAGDKAASDWPGRAQRVRPPGPYKDWTEAAQDGINLRRWWRDRLAGIEAPDLFSWDELSAWRWGPAIDNP
jgi:DNA primase